MSKKDKKFIHIDCVMAKVKRELDCLMYCFSTFLNDPHVHKIQGWFLQHNSYHSMD